MFTILDEQDNYNVKSQNYVENLKMLLMHVFAWYLANLTLCTALILSWSYVLKDHNCIGPSSPIPFLSFRVYIFDLISIMISSNFLVLYSTFLFTNLIL